MKNRIRILLLLLALFPSVCFAQSGKSINYIDYRLDCLPGPVYMRLDYDKTSHRIINVAFRLPDQMADGTYQYKALSKEGSEILFEFFYKDGALVNLHLDTSFRPLLYDRDRSNVFVLASADGQDILFTFSWEADGRIKNVNVRSRNIP